MPHTVKIDDKTYDKLKAYCSLNSLSVHTVTKEAIEFYLNDIMYGDAPFLKPNTVDSKGNVYTEEVVEKLKEEETNSKYRGKNEQLIVTAMNAEDGEKELTRVLMENQDPPLTPEQKKFIKQETENLKEFIEAVPVPTKKPSKRRL